jgi:hypothetical protein
VPSHRADTPASRRRSAAAPAQPTRRSQRTAPQRAAQQQRPATSRSSRRAATPRKGQQLSAPQVGIAGALGLATIAAPISGALAAPPPKADINPIAAVSMAPAPNFPAVAVQTMVGVEALRVIPSEAKVASTPSMLASRTILVTRASRAGERSVLPGCDGIARITSAPNGQLPRSVLCTLWESGHSLRSDAAVALAKLNIAYRQRFGGDICLTDSYRTLASQQRLASLKPGLAAAPGTSNHGWGLAVDLCDGIESGGSSRYQWMRTNAPRYGWDNPTWARPGGTGPQEPWHWEYVAGEGSDYSYSE